MIPDLHELEQRLHYVFQNKSLLRQALTHRSYAKLNNERFEFVGDGILDYVIALVLYHNYPDASEGDLSKIRAALVNQDALVEIALTLGIGEYLLLGDGEEKSGGRSRSSILADALEAIFAAVSFDASFTEAKCVIEVLYKEKLVNAIALIAKDSKSILQEYLQRRKLSTPLYNIIAATGPDHDSVFSVECVIPELKIRVSACGRSKKEASQIAADMAFRQIKERK